jgi:hypothetical protein
MKPSRTGLNLCSTAMLPRGSHHSAASAEKRATAASSTVEAWADVVVLAIGLSEGAVAAPCPRRYVYAPFRAGARRKSGSRASHRQSMIPKSGHRFSEKIMLHQ